MAVAEERLEERLERERRMASEALAVIQRLGGGRMLEELHEALIVTSEEVVNTGKAGSVTLTLKVHNGGQGDPLIIVDYTVGRTVPKRDPRGTAYYALDGALHREDPRQVRMEFRTIDRTTGEIREPEARERVERAIL